MDDKILRLLAKINLEDLPTFVNTGLPTHIDKAAPSIPLTNNGLPANLPITL